MSLVFGTVSLALSFKGGNFFHDFFAWKIVIWCDDVKTMREISHPIITLFYGQTVFANLLFFKIELRNIMFWLPFFSHSLASRWILFQFYFCLQAHEKKYDIDISALCQNPFDFLRHSTGHPKLCNKNMVPHMWRQKWIK